MTAKKHGCGKNEVEIDGNCYAYTKYRENIQEYSVMEIRGNAEYYGSANSIEEAMRIAVRNRGKGRLKGEIPWIFRKGGFITCKGKAKGHNRKPVEHPHGWRVEGATSKNAKRWETYMPPANISESKRLTKDQAERWRASLSRGNPGWPFRVRPWKR